MIKKKQLKSIGNLLMIKPKLVYNFNKTMMWL